METEEMCFQIGKDHWAFLDEIEAPMWADLNLEVKCNYKDFDDRWFHTTHMFHQCSSLQLKAAFAHSGEGNASSSSPKLPSSVSRSRGKHYTSRKTGGNCQDFALNKKHPVKALSGKTSWGNSGFREDIKPKLSFINSKGTSKLKSSLIVDRKVPRTTKDHFKVLNDQTPSEGNMSSGVDKASESNTSNITSENDQKLQQTNMEISNPAFGNSSRLVSAMRISLRKSRATRPASRVDVSSKNNSSSCGRLSRDSNSVSGKSSVGSSSNPGHDVSRPAYELVQQRDQTPSSRIEERMTQVTKNKTKESYVSTTSNIQVKCRFINSRKEVTSILSKPTQKDAANSKVKSKTLHPKALKPRKVDEQSLSTGAVKAKEKVIVSARSYIVSAGNENLTGRVPINKNLTGRVPIDKKWSNRDIANGVMARRQRATKLNLPQKDGRTRHQKGKISSPSKVTQSTLSTRRVFLR
ncbi:uncharacterized protein LOC126666131 [Mercurialis annua]|uniref:uncharacterized protein LOC126666131 n=1 Tax=Mercurialis annua TaxID=3986 RepID=UPI00215E0F24|nr:uncharacterized protein LOC126666131 [Mercurialis annua]